MAVFVHFTEENNKNSIIKNGITLQKIHYDKINKGIFCMPVIPDFYATHQWIRELKQYKSGNEIIAVYFKVPDEELVFCGKYNETIVKTKASDTHNKFLNLEDKMGFQTIISRKIYSTEITKIKNLPQIIGWRHFPKSHERKRCLCPACLSKGSYNSINAKKLKVKDLFKKLQTTNDHNIIENIICDIKDVGIKDKIGTKREGILKKLLNTNNEELKNTIFLCMIKLYGGHYKDDYKKFLFENIYNGKLVEDSIIYLTVIYEDKILDEVKKEKCTNDVIKMINKYKEKNK